MAQGINISRRREPALLLLGLLALLLWGQCGALLYPNATSRPQAFLGSVKSLDSLGTAPVTLYLTLSLRNDLSQPVLVREVSGAIYYGGRAHPFSATAALRDTLLYPWTELTHPVAIPLHLSADSLSLLRTLLQTGYAAPIAPRLQWQVRYSPRQSPDSRSKGRTLSYLLLLKPAKRKK